MIGLSLSLCIQDILAGNIKEEQVDYLIISCCFKNEEELEKIISYYKKGNYNYWSNYSISEIKNLIKRLDIRQPRLQNDKHYPHIGSGHWVESEDEIIWQDNPEFAIKIQQKLSKKK